MPLRALPRRMYARLPAPIRERAVLVRHSLAARHPSDSNADYWAWHNVTMHEEFTTREQSVDYLNWRNSQYLFYGDWLPYDKMRGKTVLDYGCGPGNDLVAVAEWGSPARLIGADVSTASLDEAGRRLKLHPEPVAELILLDENKAHVPLDEGSVDVVISSGVLHHCPNIDDILAELRRVLAPDGVMYVMVYNRESIFARLYVPYLRQIVLQIDAGEPFEEAFKRSTDGAACPHSVAYRPADFVALAERNGFTAKFQGAAISVEEMGWLADRFAAIADMRLAHEHREFLARLAFDEYGRPIHDGQVAGIDGLYELRQRR
ncbi:MAG: class I SAM-dependent methyltransferase [Mycobacteriales bacterium]